MRLGSRFVTIRKSIADLNSPCRWLFVF